MGRPPPELEVVRHRIMPHTLNIDGIPAPTVWPQTPGTVVLIPTTPSLLVLQPFYSSPLVKTTSNPSGLFATSTNTIIGPATTLHASYH